MRLGHYIVVGGLTAVANATVIPSLAKSGLAILDQYEVAGATVTWYGGDRGGPIAALQERAPVCPEPKKQCFHAHGADEDACTQLISSFDVRKNQEIPKSPQSVCIDGNTGKCCISWSRPPQNAKFTELKVTATDLNESCKYESHKVSGLVRNKILGNTCLTQCLSDRPNGCS